MSRPLARIERFLALSGFDRAPWLAVSFGFGIAVWFGLANSWLWGGFLLLCGAIAAGGMAALRADGPFPYLRQAMLVLPLVAAGGCGVVWCKSAMVGQEPLAAPMISTLEAKVLERAERPAEQRVRLVLATLEPGTNRSIRIRLNLPTEADRIGIQPGAVIRVNARLMPPAPPMLPGAYDFARTAWFAGLSATGTVLGPVEIVETSHEGNAGGFLRSRLSIHVRDSIPGAAGSIAATLASGDRGAIDEGDAQAMRDAGLAHLLSISGLHVSAVIAIAYVLILRVLALWPWLALRIRLPILAAGGGALAGIAYTLLTGAQVPTVRSCIGAILVLIALAIGREALSLRVLAVAAFFVLLLWPETLVGPSFQMSFAAVMAIIALNTSATVRRFLGPREESWVARSTRYTCMLFLMGLLIEFVLMPIGLYHFHRAGVYGAFANVLAIPVTTLVVMPLIAFALVLDVVGAGAPAWWLVGNAIDAILALAHWVSSQPGAVSTLPAMGKWPFLPFIAGGLWLALWSGRIRFLGLIPACAGVVGLLLLKPPDILISGDGRNVGITNEVSDELLVLRESRSSYVSDNLMELSGMDGAARPIADWPGARCGRDFCSLTLERGGRSWNLLMARSRERVPERALAAACERADIVIADRWLPRSCTPRWLKADRGYLSRSGGLAINLSTMTIDSVADKQGNHGWWQARKGGD